MVPSAEHYPWEGKALAGIKSNSSVYRSRPGEVGRRAIVVEGKPPAGIVGLVIGATGAELLPGDSPG